MTLKNQILDRVQNIKNYEVWTLTDFLDLGNRDAIDKTLQRLVKSSTLRRINRGLYDLPRFNKLRVKI